MSSENSNYNPEEWVTHYEKSGGVSSPSYDETIKYFEKFVRRTKQAQMKSLGYSAKGRDIKYLVISNDSDFTPKRARRDGKVVVLIQNGIHSGEIEGKDATMLLLREILITREKKHLLDNLVLLVIPVLNVDGHERISPYNRPNQNGPTEMGWRTTANNLNLNRDYLKAASPEMRALLRMFSTWMPDFYIDNHTTNGMDYQYHISYAMESHANIDTALAEWGNKKLMTEVISKVESEGFITGPYLELKGGEIEQGITSYPMLPRFSTGYAAAQNRLCLLVETHSLKPFENRVRSTKSMNEAVLEYLNANSEEIKKLNKQADLKAVSRYSLKKQDFPLILRGNDVSSPYLFKGLKSFVKDSNVTGSGVRFYTSEPEDIIIPQFLSSDVIRSVKIPFAYPIPKEFNEIVRVLKLHGVKVRQLSNDIKLNAEKYRFSDVQFAPYPYEGCQRVSYKIKASEEEMFFEKGTFVVVSGQRALKVIAYLLEPESDDSFMAWGYFNQFLERKEYAEAYVFEPIAQKMYDENEELKKEFNQKLEDPRFAASPGDRLDFWYRNSPFFDERENVYPIFRVMKKFKDN